MVADAGLACFKGELAGPLRSVRNGRDHGLKFAVASSNLKCITGGTPSRNLLLAFFANATGSKVLPEPATPSGAVHRAEFGSFDGLT